MTDARKANEVRSNWRAAGSLGTGRTRHQYMTERAESCRILFIDAGKNVRNFWKRELERDGYEVIPAADAHEALEAIQEELPDLVVIDVQMPGIEASAAGKRMLVRERSVPVIVYTAARGRLEGFERCSADAYVDKADDIEVLRSTIVRLLEGRKETQGRSLSGGEKEEKE